MRTLAQTVVLVDHSDKLPVSVTKQKSAFPPNYVHSLDSTHMLMTANEMDHRGLSLPPSMIVGGRTRATYQ